MRVLTSSVLVMEAIMLGLAIPVAVVAGGQPASAGWLLGFLAVACLLLPAAFGRPFYVPVGWALQVAVIACGALEPMLFALGAVFAALWWAALHLGRKVEQAQSAQKPPPATPAA
jgi:hypothetical protein